MELRIIFHLSQHLKLGVNDHLFFKSLLHLFPLTPFVEVLTIVRTTRAAAGLASDLWFLNKRVFLFLSVVQVHDVRVPTQPIRHSVDDLILLFVTVLLIERLFIKRMLLHTLTNDFLYHVHGLSR